MNIKTLFDESIETVIDHLPDEIKHKLIQRMLEKDKLNIYQELGIMDDIANYGGYHGAIARSYFGTFFKEINEKYWSEIYVKDKFDNMNDRWPRLLIPIKSEHSRQGSMVRKMSKWYYEKVIYINKPKPRAIVKILSRKYILISDYVNKYFPNYPLSDDEPNDNLEEEMAHYRQALWNDPGYELPAQDHSSTDNESNDELNDETEYNSSISDDEIIYRE
jgi:hypothetical protein